MTISNYLTIQGWMRTELGLSGNELIAYALIYGFSQDNETEFRGSAQYVADWCGIARENANKLLKRLTEKKLINKREEFINGVKFCRYSCNTNNIGCDETSQGGVTKHHRGCDETSHNNDSTYNREINIKKENISEDIFKKRFRKPTIEEVRDYIKAQGYTVDPEAFYDYYEANGWKVGKNPVKDWKACVRTFQRNEEKYNSSKAKPRYTSNNDLDIHRKIVME